MLPRKIKNKWLEPEKQKWIEELLRLWGGVGIWRIGFRKSGKYDLPADEICGGG